MNSNRQLSETVGKELKLRLPEDYRNFIDESGYICFDNLGIEIYGHRDGFSMTKIPSVVAATRLYRDDYGLEKDHIVISHTGFEDYIVVLDISSGQVIEVSAFGNKEVVADSFREWFSNIKEKNINPAS